MDLLNRSEEKEPTKGDELRPVFTLTVGNKDKTQRESCCDSDEDSGELHIHSRQNLAPP